MNFWKNSIFVLLIALCMPMQAQDKSAEQKWFADAKFGLFIHWGLYSQAAGYWRGIPARGGEHFMLHERIPLKEYATLAEKFNPVDFDAEKWVETLQYVGMKYIVFTSKHHEGFAMFNSPSNDYNIVARTPFHRDPLKELAEACHRKGVKLGIYYSLGRDWADPDVPTPNCWRSNIWDYRYEDKKVLQRYLNRKVYPQLKELLTQYGRVDILWFDTPELVTPEQSQSIRDYIHSFQPHCLINDRIGNGLGDYATEEQRLTDNINAKPWELCMTMGWAWGYNVRDVYYKTPEMLIRHLVDAVSKGGNMLLNIGPTDKGDFPIFTYPIIESFHVWLGENGEAIYGTRPWRTFGEAWQNVNPAEEINTEFNDAIYDGTPKENTPDFRFTAKGNTLYIIARSVKARQYLISSVKASDKVKKITLLGSSSKVMWKQTDKGLDITVPEMSPARVPVYVLKAELGR